MKKIAVFCPNQHDRGLVALLSATGQIADAQFVIAPTPAEGGFDGQVIIGANEESLTTARQANCPTLLILSAKSCTDPMRSARVDFSRHTDVPFPFAGRTLECTEAQEIGLLPAWARKGAVLASIADIPFWNAIQSNGITIFTTSTQIGSLDSDEALFDRFAPDRFLGLLPLMGFLRMLSARDGWRAPGIHANFMFDDPNLHSTRYGFMDFPALATHAHDHRYHITSATIPIDAWFVSARAAKVFRDNGDVLSLLVHGNEHVHEELGRTLTPEFRRQSMGQALRRVERLEAKSGIEVSRCMAPPHGACSADMLATLAALGFESACVSRGSLRHYNRSADWVRTLGMRPVDMIMGLPVISRFRISRNCQKSILLAAFLQQPIIPVGHHQDVADGPELLAELADFINGLGPVRWANMAQITRGMYAQRQIGSALHVRMYTNDADVAIPEQIDHLIVTGPSVNEVETTLCAYVAGASSGMEVHSPIDAPAAIRVNGAGRVTLRIAQPAQAFVGGNEMIQSPLLPPLWPIVRRLLTEGRDRLAPIYGRRPSN